MKKAKISIFFVLLLATASAWSQTGFETQTNGQAPTPTAQAIIDQIQTPSQAQVNGLNGPQGQTLSDRRRQTPPIAPPLSVQMTLHYKLRITLKQVMPLVSKEVAWPMTLVI